MTFAPSMMVKQWMGEITDSRGVTFRVFATGDSRHFLFDPIDGDGCSLCQQFAVRKASLKPKIRAALNAGCSIDLRGFSD